MSVGNGRDIRGLWCLPLWLRGSGLIKQGLKLLLSVLQLASMIHHGLVAPLCPCRPKTQSLLHTDRLETNHQASSAAVAALD